MKSLILLVEDDPDLARGLVFNLEHEGHEVLQVDRGDAALAMIAKDAAIDLVVLDLSLPDLDGLEVLRQMRARAGGAPPVICLTARGQETDIVMGLGLGAEDYVTKPFGLAELLARIQVVLRRQANANAGKSAGKVAPAATTAFDTVQLGEVTIEMTAHRARHPDRVESLTPIEIELLGYLLAHRGQALDRARILADLWGLGRHTPTRTLDNHIARLRRKIESDPSQPRFLVTVHGVGYRLETQ